MWKGGVYVIMVKIVLLLVKNVFFGLNEGISENVCLVVQKHAAYGNFNGNCMVLLVKNYQKLLIHEDAGRIWENLDKLLLQW